MTGLAVCVCVCVEFIEWEAKKRGTGMAESEQSELLTAG